MDNSKFEKEQNKVKNALFDTYTSNKLIPFIGAGFSKNIRGYPDWKEFIGKLGSKISMDLHKHFGENFLLATEFYIWKRGMEKSNGKSEKKNEDKNKHFFRKGKKKLLEHISEIVKGNPRSSYNNSDWTCHDKLVEKFDYMYTTNWDNTIELSQDHDVDIIPIYLKSQLCDDAIKNSQKKCKKNGVDKRQIKIIKFHGHYDHPNAKSLIACQKDYNMRILKENPFDIKFKNDLLHYDFFFIGYRFGDPNINLMIQEISQLMEFISEKAKSSIFWISPENFDDPRVEVIKRSLGVKVYHLLNMEKQKNLENCKTEESAFKEKKQAYLKESTLEFLDIFKEN